MIPGLNLYLYLYEEKRTELRKTGQEFKKAVENHKKRNSSVKDIWYRIIIGKEK